MARNDQSHRKNDEDDSGDIFAQTHNNYIFILYSTRADYITFRFISDCVIHVQ